MNFVSNTDRRTQIMDAFLGLIRQGRSIRSITVQEIATASGMGKGTLYEYFSSKEEILVQTLQYCAAQELTRVERCAEWDCTFEQAVDRFLRECVDETIELLSMVRLILEQMTQEQLKQMKCAGGHEQMRQRLKTAEAKWFTRGRAEGAIDASLSDEYCELVVVSAVMGLLAYGLAGRQIYRGEGLNHAAKMILRSLRA